MRGTIKLNPDEFKDYGSEDGKEFLDGLVEPLFET